jgi:outer membrane protein assembly factor BamB
VNAADHQQERQVLICLNRDTGRANWQCTVHEGGFSEKGNKKASLASSTPACDGKRVFVTFLNAGAVYASAISLDGRLLWQTKISDYVVHQGYGASPAVYGSLVIVAADNKGGGAVAGLDRETGKIVWKRERPAKPNYASPVVLSVSGRDQLIFTGCDLVTSLNPLTGDVYWETEGATTEVVTTSVTDGKRIFTSGGYPKNHISAVAADGSKEVVWENTVRTYVPSMVIREGAIYSVQDAGIASCWDSATGKQLWKGRLAGTFSSSPVIVGERMYATNEKGTTFVLRATVDGFEKLAENQLGESVFSTPVICDSRIYIRVAHYVDGQREEFLYCLGR